MADSKIKRENHIIIQGFMVTDLHLKGNELLIYACIYGFSQAENQVFNGSLRYLAEWTNSTKQGVIKCLKSLEEKQYIGKKEKYINGVKYCEYYATEFNTLLNKVDGGSQQSLTGGSQQSLPNNINLEIIENKIEDKKIYISEFAELWQIYPRKEGKANALKAYIKARKKGTTFEEIKQGIENYRKHIEAKGTPTEYIKHGSTWFNQEAWGDEYDLTATVHGNTKQGKKDNVLEYLARDYEWAKAVEDETE